ncbi:MAG: hypothetical protein ACYDIE_05335 [Candidatus Krumholzibacteriia bacterium]
MRIAWSLPPWAWPLLLAAAVGLALWTHRQYGRADPRPAPAVRRWLTGLRTSALLLLLLALAGPTVLRSWQVTRPPGIVIVVDDSASMALPDGPQGETRWSRAVSLAARLDSALSRREPAVRVRLLRGNGLTPARDLRGADGPPAPPQAVGTDLAAQLREAAGAGDGDPPQGIVLISDGHDTAGRASAAGAPGGAGGAALLVVGVGDPVGPPDRFLQDLRYPRTAFVGEEALVEVTVGVRGGTTGEAPVTVRLREGGRVVAEGSAPAPAGDGVVTLTLPVRPAAPGLTVYDLEIVPRDNERYLANNRATLAVDVRRERARLLLLAGRPDWDVRFLAQGAVAAGRLRLEVVRGGPDGLVLADSSRAWQAPRTVAGWRRWDGIVLVGWGGLGADFPWATLAAAVRDGRGLLVLAADDPAAPGPPAALAELLPVDVGGAAWRDGPLALRAVAAAAGQPLLAGLEGGTADGARLDGDRLPPLTRLLAVRPRPGAQVLLTAEPLPGAAPGAGGALLVAGREGEGRIAWFGGRDLWRLAFWESPRTSLAELPHAGRGLVRNLLVWTAGGAATTGLSLAGGRQLFAEGERVPVEARGDAGPGAAGAGGGRPPRSVLLRALDGPEAGRERVFTLEPAVGDSDRARTVLPPLPAGRYELVPLAGGAPVPQSPARAFVVVPQTLEDSQITQDRRRLRALATSAGGTFLPGESADAGRRLTEAFARRPPASAMRTLHGRWDPLGGWPLVLLATALLGAEWVLRRGQGLL